MAWLTRVLAPSTQLTERRVRVLRALVYVRYALPLAAAALLLVLGSFYNVSAWQMGKGVQLSVLQLCFNTFKSARTYLMGSNVQAGTRSFYTVLIVGGVCFIVLFLLAVAASAFALYSLFCADNARAAGKREEEKQTKVVLRAFLHNRAVMGAVDLLLLPLALYPEFFSFVCGRFLTVGGSSAVYVRCNVTAIVVGLLLLCTVCLAVYLWRYEGVLGLDLFSIDDNAPVKKATSAADADDLDEAGDDDESDAADDEEPDAAEAVEDD